MANIIDGLNKATNEDLRKLNAILKTYTLTNYFIQFFRCLGNVFRYIFRIKPKQAGMSFLYTNYQAQFDQMNREELISWLKNYLISSHRVNIKGKEITDDLLSVSILKKAAHLYKNDSYSHMSPAEMADDLKYKCADRKLTKITGVLKNWFFITLFLFIIACFLIVYYYRNYDLLFFRYYDFFSVHPDMLPRTSIVRNLITGAFVIIEVIWSKKCSSKLFYEKIGQVVALGGLAYNGPFSVSSSELIIPKMKKDVAEKFERGLRALHTLMQQIRTLEQDVQTFESLNLSLKYSINDCKNSIENEKKIQMKG